MVQKARLFGDNEAADAMMKLSDQPAKLKNLGRKVRGFDDNIWKTRREHIVTTGCYYKFKENKNLAKILLGTGERAIIETSGSDAIWGIGYTEKQAKTNRGTVKWGENLLGLALMDVRALLREDDLKEQNHETQQTIKAGEEKQPLQNSTESTVKKVVPNQSTETIMITKFGGVVPATRFRIHEWRIIPTSAFVDGTSGCCAANAISKSIKAQYPTSTQYSPSDVLYYLRHVGQQAENFDDHTMKLALRVMYPSDKMALAVVFTTDAEDPLVYMDNLEQYSRFYPLCVHFEPPYVAPHPISDEPQQEIFGHWSAMEKISSNGRENEKAAVASQRANEDVDGEDEDHELNDEEQQLEDQYEGHQPEDDKDQQMKDRYQDHSTEDEDEHRYVKQEEVDQQFEDIQQQEDQYEDQETEYDGGQRLEDQHGDQQTEYEYENYYMKQEDIDR